MKIINLIKLQEEYDKLQEKYTQLKIDYENSLEENQNLKMEKFILIYKEKVLMLNLKKRLKKVIVIIIIILMKMILMMKV